MPPQTELPLPPLELVRTVGHSNHDQFHNPSGEPVFPGVDSTSVLDIGCGCGRIARRLLYQKTPPAHYLGVDINPASINWCQLNLARPGWEFKHMDIHNGGLNPSGKLRICPIPAPNESFTMEVAWSLFTHVIESELDYVFGEAARCLAPGGSIVSTWLLFDKATMPFMQSFQNSLYINLADPINAVVYDKDFIKKLFSSRGLTITDIYAQLECKCHLVLTAVKAQGAHVEFPPDDSTTKVMAP